MRIYFFRDFFIGFGDFLISVRLISDQIQGQRYQTLVHGAFFWIIHIS